MSNSKISNLTSATTPLAGAETLPIVQGGATVKIAANDLTVRNVRANATTGILQITGPVAGSTRVATVPDANFTVARIDASQSFTGDQTLSTGNLIIGTAGKGIDFSADPNTPGMTSELLDDYEEGTWTPTYNGATSAVPAPFSAITYGAATAGMYVKIGRLVICTGVLRTEAITKGAATGPVWTVLPFTSISTGASGRSGNTTVGNAQFFAVNRAMSGWVENNSTTAYFTYTTSSTANTRSLDVTDLDTGAVKNIVYFTVIFQTP
jgi:hypothetical protein